jgi:predicted Ser/Thr protein kinase
LGLGFAAAATTPVTPPDRFLPPVPEELSSLFPDLEIHELLGYGGMGAVYKARQRRLGRSVALKILPPAVAAFPSFAERFTREAQALARLNHPNIVTLHDFGAAGDLYYFVMEYVDGVNLRQLVAAGKLEPKQALAIVPQVCDALQYAHEEGVVHRDIKPENILLDRKGRAKIADFGLAKLMHRGDAAAGRAPYTLTGSQQVMGTPHYMAPEQMERPQKVDHRADIYSLGVVFYEMLTGELPLGRFAPPSRIAAVDTRLDDVVLRTLEKEPDLRYQHASEVKSDVDRISHAPPEPWPAAVLRAPELDELDVSDIRAEVALPAGALRLVGALGFIVAFLALFIVIASIVDGGMHLSGSIWLAALTLPFSALIAVGGSLMSKLRSYGFACATSFLAILPCHLAWLIGVPVGIWALIVLSRPAARRAFGFKEVERRERTLLPYGLLILIGCLIIAPLIAAGMYLFVGIHGEHAESAAISIQSPPMPLKSTSPSNWILTPAGPKLSDVFASWVLKLQPRQIELVNKVLATSYEESVALEARNTERQTDDAGHVIVTIKPYAESLAKLEHRTWSQLDEILDPQQQSIARLNLKFDPPEARHETGVALPDLVGPGFFGWGKHGAHLEFWRMGSWYHWKVKARGYEDSSSAPELPIEYRRFMQGPANDQPTQDVTPYRGPADRQKVPANRPAPSSVN